MEFQSPALHRPLPIQNAPPKPQQTKVTESNMVPPPAQKFKETTNLPSDDTTMVSF